MSSGETKRLLDAIDEYVECDETKEVDNALWVHITRAIDVKQTDTADSSADSACSAGSADACSAGSAGSACSSACNAGSACSSACSACSSAGSVVEHLEHITYGYIHKYTKVNGKIHGEYSVYNSVGDKMYSQQYAGGKKNGKYISYFLTGVLAIYCTWSCDKLHGVYKKYRPDCSLEYSRTYDMGIPTKLHQNPTI